MPKWLKTIIAVLMLPLCFGTTKALFGVIRASGDADTVWVATMSGVACWIVVYLLLPKPMLIYVVGHELTHAVWTWAFGGKVKRFKARSSGGHVVVSKSNSLIALAPYFFPLYVVLVILCFVIGDWLWGWTRYRVWFHLLIGATYAFHVTLTLHVLKKRQSDITRQGYLFSAVIIWLGNAAVLLTGISLLMNRVDLLAAFGLVLRATGDVIQRLGRFLS
jgi:C4-dicarboxylate transporter